MFKSNFVQETVRKEELLTRLEEHEWDNQIKPEDPVFKNGIFDCVYTGVAEVIKVENDRLHLAKEGGEKLGQLMVTPEIALLSKVEDHLVCTLGRRLGRWHLIEIQMISSPFIDNDGKKQMHLSGVNRHEFHDFN